MLILFQHSERILPHVSGERDRLTFISINAFSIPDKHTFLSSFFFKIRSLVLENSFRSLLLGYVDLVRPSSSNQKENCPIGNRRPKCSSKDAHKKEIIM